MDKRDVVLGFVRTHGPCLPSDVAKHINTSILIASAILSELSSKGLVNVSKLKIGGSPVYYVKGQEEKLIDLFYKRLNDKDKKAFDLLRQKKILLDSDLEPIMRVALHNLGDFAIPISVKYNDKKLLFWKWFLLSDSELKTLLDEFFGKKTTLKDKVLKEQTEKQKLKQQGLKQQQLKLIQQEKQETQQARTELKEKSMTSKLTTEQTTKQRTKRIGKRGKKSEKQFDKTEFYAKIMEFFKNNDFEVLNEELLSKKEFDFVVMMPTPVGKVKYYCKAWNKKRINDADLSKVFVKAQSKGLPCVLLTTGSLTKKAKQLLNKEVKGLIVKEIE